MTEPTYPPYVLIIIGKPGSGKTTVADTAARAYGLKRGSTTLVTYAHVLSDLMTKTGLDQIEANKVLMALEKDKLREKLTEAHAEMLERIPSFFTDVLMRGGIAVIEGIYTQNELNGTKAFCAEHGIRCETWWIERDFGNQAPVYPPWDVTPADADLTLENDTPTAQEMAQWVDNFIRTR